MAVKPTHEELGKKDGIEFLDFVVRDLKALGEHSYDGTENCFVPLVNDGRKLSPEDGNLPVKSFA